MAKLRITIELSDEEVELLKREAATYKSGLGITWKNVAQGWARYALDQEFKTLRRRASEVKETK